MFITLREKIYQLKISSKLSSKMNGVRSLSVHGVQSTLRSSAMRLHSSVYMKLKEPQYGPTIHPLQTIKMRLLMVLITIKMKVLMIPQIRRMKLPKIIG